MLDASHGVRNGENVGFLFYLQESRFDLSGRHEVHAATDHVVWMSRAPVSHESWKTDFGQSEENVFFRLSSDFQLARRRCGRNCVHARLNCNSNVLFY